MIWRSVDLITNEMYWVSLVYTSTLNIEFRLSMNTYMQLSIREARLFLQHQPSLSSFLFANVLVPSYVIPVSSMVGRGMSSAGRTRSTRLRTVSHVRRWGVHRRQRHSVGCRRHRGPKSSMVLAVVHVSLHATSGLLVCPLVPGESRRRLVPAFVHDEDEAADDDEPHDAYYDGADDERCACGVHCELNYASARQLSFLLKCLMESISSSF